MALFKKQCVCPVVIYYPVTTLPAVAPAVAPAAAPAAYARPVGQAPANLRNAKG